MLWSSQIEMQSAGKYILPSYTFWNISQLIIIFHQATWILGWIGRCGWILSYFLYALKNGLSCLYVADELFYAFRIYICKGNMYIFTVCSLFMPHRKLYYDGRNVILYGYLTAISSSRPEKKIQLQPGEFRLGRLINFKRGSCMCWDSPYPERDNLSQSKNQCAASHPEGIKAEKEEVRLYWAVYLPAYIHTLALGEKKDSWASTSASSCWCVSVLRALDRVRSGRQWFKFSQMVFMYVYEWYACMAG